MKKLVLLGVILAGNVAFAQIVTRLPEWKVTVKVVNEDGRPVPDAKVGVGSSTNLVDFNIERMTDTNGIVTVSAHAAGVVGCVTKRPGYYRTVGPDREFRNEVNGRWQPWNPLLKVTLKRIVNPIPMYAKRIIYEMPTNDTPVGLDLVAGEWLPPYGDGKHADMLFTTYFDKRSENDFDYRLVLSFPNPGDGIQGFASDQSGSALRSPHEAPQVGYKPQATKSDNRRPGQHSSYIWNEKTNYFFRVQTVLDKYGNVKTALYGKIYRDFNQFTYYLNPTPNDRNVEFDPKHNLLTGLRATEQVTAP